MDGEFFIILLLYCFGFGTGMLGMYMWMWLRHGGWLKLPQNSTLVFTVDRARNGHFWDPGEVPSSNHVELPYGNGMIELDPESAIWLSGPKVKLFLHYIDYFRTVPAKHAAFFTHFKARKKEVEDAVKEGKTETLERQSENQPESGVVFDIADVMHWCEYTPAQLLEGVLAAGLKYTGLKELLLQREGGFNWKLFLIIAGVIIAMIFVFMLFGGHR